MTPTCTSSPRRMLSRLVVGLGPAIALSLALLGGPIQAASPTTGVSPTPSASPTAPATAGPRASPTAAATPRPTLTMGPLVTLPPIAVPAAMAPMALADGYALGAADAPVTVEVWEDFQCPYCRRFTEAIEPQLITTYVLSGEARLVFRDLPFLGEESRWASVAARLAEQQGRFWPVHDYLFANQLGENVGSFTLDRLLVIAEAAGLDMDRFTAGLQMDAARATYAQIEAQAREGATALAISATPTVVVNGVVVAQPDLASIGAAIDAVIAAGP